MHTHIDYPPPDEDTAPRRCDVTFVHTKAAQATFKKINFQPPRRCQPCADAINVAKRALFKVQLAAMKQKKEEEKQALRTLSIVKKGPK